MPLPSLFKPTFTNRARATALDWACQEYTFADLDARANRMARVLTARGLSAGSRLAIYLLNRLEYIDLFLACTRLGAVVVPINVLYRERELTHILADSSPTAVVAVETSVPGATPDLPVWSVDALAAEAAAQSSAALHPTTIADDAPAALIYTSGTTGAAKGAVITHANLTANARTLVDAWRITASDRFLLALPLFHVHGLGNGVHCWLLSGCRTRLLERFEHQSAAATMSDFAPTLFFGVPTMYVRLLEVEAATASAIGATLRLCVSGSAPLPMQVLEEFEARFGQRILERYGMTETLMTIDNPYDGERRAGTVGLPLAGVSIRIVGESGAPVPDGETGELLVRSPTMFAGYWNRPEATAAAFSDGWFRTGDIAERSVDGYVTLKGRRSDLIISGGFNVYPREIEELLAEHPAVAEAAVAGRPDPRRGEVPVAFVVCKPGAAADAEGLISYCRERLASFKVPKAVVFLERLPRTALGKVQKGLLVS
jgi:malonyl-CoA/methylmalonyl-CoA synthetase